MKSIEIASQCMKTVEHTIAETIGEADELHNCKQQHEVFAKPIYVIFVVLDEAPDSLKQQHDKPKRL